MLNGVVGDNIAHRCGLQQGDTLSPFLFVLAVDPLHHLIMAAVEQQLLEPIPCHDLKLRVSLYANDAVIFVNPKQQEVDNLMSILRDFGAATGMCINPDTFSIAPIHEEINIQEVLQGFGGSTVTFPDT